MLSTSCIDIIKKQVSVSSFLFALPYEWDDKSGRIKLITSARRKNQRFKFSIFVWAYLGFLIFNAMRTFGSKNNNSAFLTALGVMWTTMIFGSIHCLLIGRRLEAEFLSLFNCLLDLPIFNERDGDQITKYILSFGLLLSIIFGPSVGCLLWILPCMPPFPGSILLECDPNGFAMQSLGILGRVVVIIQSISNIMVWSYVVRNGVFYIFDVFPMAVVGVTTHIEGTRSYQIITNVKTHAKMYRQAQLLTSKLNECFQSQFLPMAVSSAGIIQIICLYVSIAKWKNIPTAAFLFFPLVTADTTIILFGMLGLASKVLIKSQQTLIGLKKCSPKNRWFKRFLKSCPPQRVGFASSNFIDQTTPLVITQHCISQTVSLMLLDR